MSVESRPTRVSVAVGKVRVPVFMMKFPAMLKFFDIVKMPVESAMLNEAVPSLALILVAAKSVAFRSNAPRSRSPMTSRSSSNSFAEISKAGLSGAAVVQEAGNLRLVSTTISSLD